MTVDSADGRRTPPLVAGAFGLIIVLLVLSIGLQAGVINPTTQSNHSELSSQGAEIKAVACASSESTANAYRVRSENPKTGELESLEHFLTRMLAQRHTLLASKGIGCTSAKGFPPFEIQVKRALRQIAAILADHPVVDVHHRPDARKEPAPAKKAASSSSASQPTSKGGEADAGGQQAGSSQAGDDDESEVAPSGGGHKGSSESLPHPPRGGGQESSRGQSPSSPVGPTAPPEASATGSVEHTSSERVETTVVETPAPTPAPAPEPTPPAKGGNGLGQVVEGAGTTLEETGGTVNETVGGVQETTCTLAKLLCP